MPTLAGKLQRWGFDYIAQGLVTPDPADAVEKAPVQVSKRHNNNVLFSADGTRVLSGEEADAAVTWRSHHAFGARCGTVSRANQHGTGSCHPDAADRPASTDDWSVGLHLHVDHAEPHVLVSVAPRYLPHPGTSTEPHPTSAAEADEYVKRMVETPLIYEEPYAVSVECTAKGLFLWSDHWEIYAHRIADRCMLPRSFEAGLEGLVRVCWRGPGAANAEKESPSPAAATLTVSLGSWASAPPAGGRAASGPRVVPLPIDQEVTWETVYEVSLELADPVAARASFAPYVTLMEAGETANILQ